MSDYGNDENKKWGRIFVEINGKITDITDLEQKDYEEFLDKMKSLEIMYNILKTK